MKNVQISQDLFCDLILYRLYNNPSAEEAIRRELSRKLNAMICHERFTQYKTAATEAEREQARQRYLESIGSVPSPRRAPVPPLGERKGAFDAKCQKPPSVDTTEGRQSAYSHSSSLVRKRFRTSFSIAGRMAGLL